MYTVTNPLAAWDSETRNELLESLDFNLRAAAVYQATDGLVVQEGSDTLRIQKSGKLTFHAAESGPARFQALSAREKDLQLQAERILNTVAQPRLGEGRLVCQSVEIQEDGSVVLNYACLLGGSQDVHEDGADQPGPARAPGCGGALRHGPTGEGSTAVLPGRRQYGYAHHPVDGAGADMRGGRAWNAQG